MTDEKDKQLSDAIYDYGRACYKHGIANYSQTAPASRVDDAIAEKEAYLAELLNVIEGYSAEKEARIAQMQKTLEAVWDDITDIDYGSYLKKETGIMVKQTLGVGKPCDS